MKRIIRKGMLFGIGSAILTKEAIEKRVNALVKDGKLNRQEGKKLVKEFLADAKRQGAVIDKAARTEFARTVKQLKIVHKKEMKALRTQTKKLRKAVGKKTRKGARRIAREILRRT